MKIQRLICLDWDINENLRKEKNASLLINNLLSSHFTKERLTDINEYLSELDKEEIEKEQNNLNKEFERDFLAYKFSEQDLKMFNELKYPTRVSYFREKIWKK